MSQSEQWIERYQGAVMNTYGPPRLTLERGEGAWVWDVDGHRYLDLLAGIAVNALGHGHPALVKAVSEQVATLAHVSNFFATRPQVRLAERLLGLLGVEPGGDGRVFFCNSGTEASEAAFKLSRRTGRTGLVAATGGFHGRSMGALALTAKAAFREPFAPLPGDVTFVPYGDADALAAAVDETTAAVVLEPVQGEAGAVVAPAGYLEAAAEIDLASTAPCCGWTRCSAASAAPARGSRTPPAGSARRGDPGQGPRRRRTDRRDRRAGRSGATCCSRATTAPPSAAIRWPPPRRSR